MFVKKILFCLFILLFSTFALAKSIVLGTTNWPPYVQDDPEHKGYAYEIVFSAFKAAGYDEIKIIFMPWEDALNAVNEGELDGVFPEYYSHKRNDDVLYSHSFSDSPVGFYKKANSNIEYSNPNPDKNVAATLKSMDKYRFGVVKGYVNMKAFDQNTHLTKIYADSDEDNLKQLFDGKVDLAFIDEYTAEYLIYHQLPENYREQLTFMYPPLGYKKLYVGISRKKASADEIVEDFNRGLEIIKKNGLLADIIDRDAEIADDYDHLG